MSFLRHKGFSPAGSAMFVNTLSAMRCTHGQTMKCTDQVVQDNHKRYIERIDFYKKHGYDLLGERKAILQKILPLNNPILEIGTGKGHLALILAQYGYRFTTIDIMPEDQQIARMNLAYYNVYDHAEYMIQNAEHLAFDDHAFKTILCVNVVHHLDRPFSVYKEMLRVCAPGGRIILSDMNDKGFSVINYCHSLEGRTHDRPHHQMSDAEEFFVAHRLKTEPMITDCQYTIMVHT
ncbi:MAG: methyltransferase domain-containing protein [Elusimicrobia bacterium]|nr:methyltransferase domain-containing protein [Elusimicrobiota bacterium]MBD3412657.1 methyltransferase domain-containing protein [Elusimicrobiota bacterium]